jgi:hypothetical protein
MKHLSEEQIILHCYGDAKDAQAVIGHLEECAACRGEFERLRELLREVGPFEVPEPPTAFEESMWLKLRDRLPAARGRFRQWLPAPQKWAIAGAVVVLAVAGFLAGRYSSRRTDPERPSTSAATNSQRLVLVAVGDHLERSQILLVEFMNADSVGTLDLANEQKQARDLLDANHLYRVSAQHAGDPQIEGLLEQLGRTLTEIADSPSDLSAADVDRIRKSIQSEGLLFKVRIVGAEVNSRMHRQEPTPAGSANQRL